MNTSTALTLVLERAAQERDRRAAEKRRGDETVQRARAQLQQLDAYRGEYQARWSRQFAAGSSIDIVQCFRSFMQRLDEAVAQQDQQVRGLEQRATVLHHKLLEAELRLASVRKLIERRQADAARAAERRDQRATDETALTQTRRRPRADAALEH